MQSSFEVLEWESTSKEQDYLVHQLFGKISDSTASKTSSVSVTGDGLRVNEGNKLIAKRGKRKAINNDESSQKPKRKRKDKREKNKFKTDHDQKLKSQLTVFGNSHSETTLGQASEQCVTSFKGINETAGVDSVNQSKKAASVDSVTQLDAEFQVHKSSEESTERKKKKAKKKRKEKSKKDDASDNSELPIVGSETTLISEFGEHKSSEESIEGKRSKDKEKKRKEKGKEYDAEDDSEFLNVNSPTTDKSTEQSVEGERKKDKKKKRKDNIKQDYANDDSELPNVVKSAPGKNHKHKTKKTENVEEQDCSEPTKNHSPKLKDKSVDVFSTPVSQNKLSLHEKMTKQLESSRFRWINEQLYTTTGDEAVEMFSEDPSLFDIYHRGFTNQVKLWPVNPVDEIIEWLKNRPTSHVVADFGCGEAVIAQSVTNRVHSFDLVAKNKFVTACNMAKVPLNPESVDIAVFCLSLMGTNLVDFLREAHRVLKLGGILKVAEVTSRINDTTEFTKSLSRLGFQLQKEDTSNKMFVLFDFIKDTESAKAVPSHKLEGLRLKPCIYKKR